MDGYPEPAKLDLVLPARWSSPHCLRRQLHQWLCFHRWPLEHGEDLVLAVSEAVSNSIEHGYLVGPEQSDHPGTVSVHAHLVATDTTQRYIHVQIHDRGTWRLDDHDPHGLRGRGLPLMSAMAASVRQDIEFDGTTIELCSHPVPAIRSLPDQGDLGSPREGRGSLRNR